MTSSSFRHRARVGVFAVLALAIALYLGLYQSGAFGSVWEPFFGAGSRQVLHSPLASKLPIPDALLGAFAYLLEIITLCIGGDSRSIAKPWAVLMYLGIALAIGLTGIGLISYQSFVIHQWCTLCLEAIARIIGERRAGNSWSIALRGNAKENVKHAP